MFASAGIEVSSSALLAERLRDCLDSRVSLESVLSATAPVLCLYRIQQLFRHKSLLANLKHIRQRKLILDDHIRQCEYVFMPTKQPFDIERFFQALGDRTRLRLLNLMGDQEICVCYFVEDPRAAAAEDLAPSRVPAQRRDRRRSPRGQVDALPHRDAAAHRSRADTAPDARHTR